ncbi:MAG: ATP-grasp domain-containing protein [Actinobacteria bacterium]|nr:ATP-grasp domain-containing protein [Actinomycetota bacterium]
MTTLARVAIVDPYSSGALLAPAFHARGLESVAVQTHRDVPLLFRSSFAPQDFAAILEHRRDPGVIAAGLRRLGVRYVLAGSEPGVELADELCERLGLDRNGSALRSARRHKYLMIEAVRARGLQVPDQFHSPELGELRDWMQSRGGRPVVVKPPGSVASDSVTVCRTEAELAQSHEAIAGRTNVLGLRNDTVVVQELLEGPEYVVDTVSHGGRHRVAAFWRYHRPRRRPAEPGVFYEAIELLPYRGERQEKLFAYVARALDALEISYGPAHSEVIWARGRGPTLVEVGARLSAGSNAVISGLCGGPSALDLTVEACLDPDRFHAGGHPDRLTSAAVTCFLVRPAGHRPRPRPPLAEIRRLRSFHRMSIARGATDRRVVGAVTFIHPVRRIVREDVRLLRRFERERLYEPLPARGRKV